MNICSLCFNIDMLLKQLSEDILVVISPLFLSVSLLDVGSILKVVSITQENWSTEEVVLEELQVFQV